VIEYNGWRWAPAVLSPLAAMRSTLRILRHSCHVIDIYSDIICCQESHVFESFHDDEFVAKMSVRIVAGNPL